MNSKEPAAEYKKALVIIPTYNEIENVSRMIDTVLSLPEKPDILIVDDNSPDGTGAEVKKIMKTQKNHNANRT